MLYRFACYKHLEPTVSGSPFNLFIHFYSKYSTVEWVREHLDVFGFRSGQYQPHVWEHFMDFFHRFVIRLVWCRNTESRNV